MSFNISDVLTNMKTAAYDAVKDDVHVIPDYINEILEGEKEALKILAEERLAGNFTDEEFLHELEREKDVLQTQMLTIEIMTLALAQKAVNAAMDVLIKAISLVI